MKELKTRFPEGFVDYEIVYDTTPFIRESVNEVFYTLRDAVILVAIVVLVFLQDWKAMILPMIDVPVSLIGTFAIMAAMGFTLNNLTLFGLVLAIGIVVDDAIVVLENIERLIATGLDARTATIKAMDEITGPVLAITLVLSSVFIPCCFLGGVSGQFFRQFAVTISVSTIISAVNALTMTPSRAVVIFRTEERVEGWPPRAPPRGPALVDLRHLRRNRHVLRGPAILTGRFDLNAALRGHGNTLPSWLTGAIVATVYIPPGLLGRGLGVVHHPARQRRAGLPLRRFQPLVRLDDGTLWPGRRPHAATEHHGPGDLRRALGHDVLAVPAHAHGLHSATGQGLPPAQCAIARFRLRGAHASGRSPASRRSPWATPRPRALPRHAGHRAHGRPFRPVVDLERQRAQPGLDVRPAEAVRQTARPAVERRRDCQVARRSAATSRCGGPSSRPSARRRSTAWARPAASS